MTGTKGGKRRVVENEGGKISSGADNVESLDHGIHCRFNEQPLMIFLNDANLIYDL